MVSGVVSPLLASLFVISLPFAFSPFGCSFLVNLLDAFMFNLYDFVAQISELIVPLFWLLVLFRR